MKNKSYLINGKRYRLEHITLKGKNNGYCDPPFKKGKKIIIHKRRNWKSSKRLLEDYIHELLHACSWDLTEEWVEESAHSIMNVLWNQGYRIVID